MKVKKINSSIEVTVPLEVAFHHIFNSDLLLFFKRFWYVPRFVIIPVFKNETDRPGYTRMLYLEGINSAKQELITLIAHKSFSVKINQITSPRFIALTYIIYQYSFVDLGSGVTKVNCEYSFTIKSGFISIFFNLFVQNIVREQVNIFLAELLYSLKNKTA